MHGLVDLSGSLTAKSVPAPPGDASVAAGIRRVCNAVRSRTLDMPGLASGEMQAFMSIRRNEFPEPQTPGNYGLSAFDAHYSMALYYARSPVYTAGHSSD